MKKQMEDDDSQRFSRRRVLQAGLAAAVVGALGQPSSALTRAGASEDAAKHTVTQADYDRWKVELSNWGRWGKDDEMGTLNLITPEKRKQAAALVRDGFVVSLAHDLLTEKTVDNPSPLIHKMVVANPTTAMDEISNGPNGLQIHGAANTHLDALCHKMFDGKAYNGYAQGEYITMEKGATKNSVLNMKDGIFTRAVLMDIPRLKGVDFLESGTPVFTEDLEAWEKKAGVKIEPGDAVFFRVGRWARRAKLGPFSTMESVAGLDASVIPWLKKQDIALMGSEAALSVEPSPSWTQISRDVDIRVPVHNFVICSLGTPLIDHLDLDRVSEACAVRKRWDFLVTLAPMPIPFGTGSPINPTAVF